MSSELVRRESWAEPEPGSQPELAPEPEPEPESSPVGGEEPSPGAGDGAVDGAGTEDAEDPVEPLESLEDAEAADTAEVAEEARLLRLRCPSAATAIAAVRESEDEAKRRREAAALTEAIAGEGGISIAQVAAKYGMPRSTLQDRVRRYRHLQQQLAGADDEPAQTQDVQTPPQAPQTRPKSTPKSTPQRATATPVQRTHRTPRKPAKVSPGSASKRRSEARPASWPEVAALISRRLSIPIELAESVDRAIVSVLAGWGTDERAAATIGRTPDWIRQQTGRYKREPSRFQWRKRLSGAPECYEPAFDAPAEDNESYSEETDSDDSGGGPWHGFPLEVKFACEADAPPDGGLARLPLLPMPVRVRRGDAVRRTMPVLQGPLDRRSREGAAARTVESGSRQPDGPSVEATDRLPVGPPVIRPDSPTAGRPDTPPVTSSSADPADSSPDEPLDDRPLASPSVDTSERVPATVDRDRQDELTPVRTQETVTRPSDDSGVDQPAERAPSPPCAAETLPSDGPVETSDGASLSHDGASLSHPPAVSPRAESPRAESPERAASPERVESPLERAESPLACAVSPLERAESPLARAVSPLERAVSPLARAASPAFSADSTASSAESILRIVESLPLSDRSPSPAESLTHARSPSRHAESPRRHSRSPSPAHGGVSSAGSPGPSQSDEKTKSDDDSAPKPAESPVKSAQSPARNAENSQPAENQSQSTASPSQPVGSPRESADREATPPPSSDAATAAAEADSPASTTVGARSDRERSTDSTRRRRRGSEHSSHRRDRSDDSDHRSQDRKKKKKKKHHSSDGEEGSRRRSKDRKKKKKKRRSSSHDKEKKGRSRRDKHRSKEEDDVDKLIIKTKRRESARLAEEKQRTKEEEVDELILKTKRRESARLAEERLVREAEKLLQAKAAAPASTRSLRSGRSGSGGAVEAPASDAVDGAAGRDQTPEKVGDVGASEEAAASDSPRASDADGGEQAPTEEPTTDVEVKDKTGAGAEETATATVTQEDQKLPADDAAAGTSTDAAEAETTTSKQEETPPAAETSPSPAKTEAVTKESLAAARASASAAETATDTKQEDLFTEASAGDAGTSSSPGEADTVKPQDEALYAWLLGHMGSKKAAEKFGVGRMMVRARRDAMTKEQRVEFVKKMKKHYESKGVAAAKPAPERPAPQSAAPARPAKPKPSFGEALMLPETTLSPRRRRGVASGSETTPARKDRGERKSGRGDESPSAPAAGGEKDDPAERPPRLTRTAVRRILHRLAECPEDGVDTRTALEAQLALPPAGVTRLVTMVRQRRHSPMAVFSVYCRLWREAGEAAASPTKRRPEQRSAADVGGGGDGPTAAGDRSTAGEDGHTASGDAKRASRGAKLASGDGQTMHEDVQTDVGDSHTPSRDAATPGTPGETAARAQRHRRPPKRLEGYLDVHVTSPASGPAPAPAPATSDLCARAEAAARAASAVERGLCPSADAAARYGVTPEELAEASRTLHNMPQIKMKLKTLGMRRAVAAVLRGRSQQWAVSTCKVSAMTLWKTLKKLREAGLIGQHIGKRRFIGGEADPAPSVSAADAAADTAEDSEPAPPADGAGDRRGQRLSAADTADDYSEPPATPADEDTDTEDTGADTDWVGSKAKSDHSPSRGRGRGSRGQSAKVREAMAAINSGQMTKVAAAKKFGISQNYIYKVYSRLMKKSKAVASETATASSDPRVERIRAALAEATQSSESRASIAKKYGINYFTFHYYWKRHQEGKPLMAGRKTRPPAPAAAASPASLSVSEPDSPAPPAVDPESISEAMRKAIGAVILGKMCIKASSSLHRVPFVQLKALCQSMTARYDSKGAVVVESAEQPAPSRQQPALTSAAPVSAAAAGMTSDTASGTPKRLKVLVKSEPATPATPAAAGVTEPMTAKQHRRALTGLRPQMAAAVRDVLAGSPAEQAAEAHGVSAGKLRLVLRCRGLAAPAVSKLTLTRTAAGYQVNRAAAAAAAAAAADGLNLREAAERVILLGEQAATVASALSLDVTLLERHCTRRPAPEPHFHAVRDEIPVLYAALALCEQGYDINVDSLRWMFAEFLTKSGQSTPPEGEEWLSLESLYARWPELRGQISTEPGAPTEAFCDAFTTALNTVCDELELKLGELVLHDAESARRRRTREVLPLPVAAAPPAGHIWDNRNGSWILEKDGKQQAFFEVETILARRDPQTAGGQPEYLIRWKGYTDSWNTWEPEGNLECTDTLAAFQRRWDSVPDDERRRIIEQLSPVSSAPATAAAVTSAAAGAAAGAAGTPARAAAPAGKKGTPASLSRKGRPPKTSQQTLDGMAAARKAKVTPSAGQLRVRTDLGVGDSASPAPASSASTCAPVSTSASTPAPSQTQTHASDDTPAQQQQAETPAPAGEETRGRRSTKARANALFKQWLVSPKQATRQAVQESLADVPAGTAASDGPPPPPPVSAVPTTPSPSTPGGSGRPRPNLSVSRVLSSGSSSGGGSGGGQRRLDEFVVRGSGGGAKLGGRASSDAPRTRDSPVRPGPPAPPPAQPAVEESIESETERLRKLDEELRLLDEEEAAAAGTSSGETPPPPEDGDADPTEAMETASATAADEADPETASPRRDRAERRRRSQSDSATAVGAGEQTTPKAADARRVSRDIMETRRRSSDDFVALTPKKTAPEPVADAREGRRKSKRLGDDAETTDEIIGKRRISRASESEREITKDVEHERRPSKEVDGERNASQEAKNERRILKEVEKKRKSSEEEKGKITTEEASEDNRKTVKETGSSAPAATTEAVATGSVAVEAGQKTAPAPTQNPVVVVVRRGRGRPPKSPEKRAALEARLASEAAALSAGGTPTTVIVAPPRRSVPLDDDAPLSKRRRTSEGGEATPAPTPTPDSAVGKRQRKVPKRFLDGETLLWGETPLPSVPDRPTADAAIAAARPAAAARSAPPPARPPPADGDSPRPITFEPPNKRKPIVFVSPIRKEGGIPIAPRPPTAGASAVRRLDLDGPQRSHPHKIIVRPITKTVGRPATKPAPPPPPQQPQPQHAPMQMMILDDSADVVIEDGPVIIDESGQLVSVRSMAAPVTPAAPARLVSLPPPPPPPPAAATTPVAADAPVKKRRGRPPKIPRPDGYSPAQSPSHATPRPTSTPKSTTTTATAAASGKTPLPGKKRGRKPKPRPEPEPEPVVAEEEMEEPEEVTLDLSSLVNTSAGADLDADVGYFDVNGQFVERCSPMKGGGGGGDWGAGGAHYGLDGVAADDTTGMLDGSLVLVHSDSELGSLSIGGEAI